MPSYFPARDLRMVVEDIDALSDALRSNAKQMVLFKAKESGDDSYRVFDPEDWPDDDELAEKLRRELGEWSALPIVRVRGRAAGVVVRNGAVIGVQIGDMSHVRGRRGPAGRDLSTYFDLAFDAPSGSIAGGRPRDDGRESGPGPTRGPSDDRSPVVRRTPHMDPHPVDPPTPVGSTFTVDVYADDEVMAEDEGGADIAVELPPDVDSIMLTVRLAVTAHFRVRGRDKREIRISREEIKSRRVRFNLQVEDVPGVGTAGIQALFSYHGRPCGFVGRT